VEALERSAAICRQADVIAALSLEVLGGTNKAFMKGKYMRLVSQYITVLY
jgi:histidine ammonia-lyase